MRRALMIRCVSSGTVRTEHPDGARCELRELLLELDGRPAHVQIVETCNRAQRTRDCTVEFDRIAVRTRAGHDLTPPASARRVPLDWLLAIAESMEEGESRAVALWVRSLDPAALLQATPVTAGRYWRLAHEAAEDEGTAPILQSPSLRLRLVAAGS